MKRVAVEDSLKNVKNYLQEKGYTVESLNGNRDNIGSYDAIVVSGQDSNLLGMHDTSTKALVINTKGLTVEDVHRQLESRVK